MKNWEIVKLDEVLKHRKGFIEIDDFQKYKLCRVQNWARGVVLRSELLGTEIKTKKQQVCKAGDFLVAEIDAKMGGYGIVPNNLEGAVVSSHYFLYDVVTDKLDRDFLDFFVKTPQFFEQIKAEGSTNYAAIRPNDVLSYKIPLPPLAEQQRIVARLSALKNKIDAVKVLRAEQMKASEAMEQQFLKSFFEKVHLQAENKPFGSFCDVVRGGSPRPAGDPTFYGDGFLPFLKIGDVTNDKNIYVQDYRETITELGLSKTRVVEANTLLLTNSGATLGVPKITSFKTSFNDGIQAFINFTIDVNLEYLYYFLFSKTEDFRNELARGQGQPNLNTEMSKKTLVPLPDFTTQSKIVTDIKTAKAKFETLKKYQNEQIALLNGIFPSLLDKAFRGEL